MTISSLVASKLTLKLLFFFICRVLFFKKEVSKEGPEFRSGLLEIVDDDNNDCSLTSSCFFNI